MPIVQAPSVVPIIRMVAMIRTTPLRARPAVRIAAATMVMKSAAPTPPETKRMSVHWLWVVRCAATGISLNWE